MRSSPRQPRLTSTARHARGAAMMMVLTVVATASILSWAMLSASAMRSQLDVNSIDATDASYMAESGVSYAMYYLRYPEKAPVTLTTGSYNSYYAGQTGLTLWSGARGTCDIFVTNTAKYCYTIRSVATVNGTRRVMEADVKQSTKGFPITMAAGFNGDFGLPNAMTINGTVLATGTVSNQGSRITNSPMIVAAGKNVVPASSEILLLDELTTPYTGPGALATDRTYTWNGGTYAAEQISGSTVSLVLQTIRPLQNPKNVWWTDNALTLNGVTMTGTIVMRSASQPLTITGTNKITAMDGMAALIANKTIDLKQSTLAGKLTVNGAVWVADKVTSSGTVRPDGTLTVNGALLMGGASPSITLTSTSATAVAYTSNYVSSVDNLSKTRTVTGVTVTGWRNVE